MKYLSVLMVLLCMCFGSDALAQSKKAKTKKVATCEFSVKGVCDMCEKRIEKAALIKGVKMAEWNKETQMVKVIYATKKVNEEDIHEAIAEAGHDTDKQEATTEAYGTLPDCCAYRNGVEVH